MSNAILSSIDSNLKERWDHDGSVVIRGLFWWWWDLQVDNLNYPERTVAEVVTQEYDMYNHHLRQINRKDNMG